MIYRTPAGMSRRHFMQHLAGASALSHLLEGATGSYAAGFLVQIGLVMVGGGLLALVHFPSRESEAS